MVASLRQTGNRSITKDFSMTLPQNAWIDLELNVPVTVGTVAFRSQEPEWLIAGLPHSAPWLLEIYAEREIDSQNKTICILQGKHGVSLCPAGSRKEPMLRQ